MKESSVLLHVWDVDPDREAADVGQLERMFGKLVNDPGFARGRVLQSADRTSMVGILEMRSVEDRQRLEQLPDVRETLDHLHGTANIVIRVYHQVGEYHA